MTKNLYFRHTLRRENVLKKNLLLMFYGLSSYPRLLLEVFIRKNFGERYFKFSSAITTVCIAAFLPLLFHSRLILPGGYFDNSSFWKDYTSWYLYLALFLWFSYQRKLEVDRNPSVYDFAKFSLYAGDIDKRFSEGNILGIKPTIRQVETLVEPAPFFIGGILLLIFGQPLGTLLIVSSLLYGFGYAGAYHFADEFIMDKIDEILCNQFLENAFVNDAPPQETKGVVDRGRKPANREMRKQIAKFFKEEEPEVVEAK
jgi:hypothetical protein